MRFSVTPFDLALVVPFTTAHATVSSRSGMLVTVIDGGHVGHGEVSPMPGWSPIDTDRAGALLLSSITAVDAGRDFDDVLDDLEDAPEVRAGLAGAVADFAARRRGLSLAQFLDPDALTSVAVNAVVGSGAPVQSAATAREAVGRGFATIKMKVGVESPEIDIRRVAEVREAIGPGVELRLDANGGWSARDAQRVLDAVALYDISFCEEPVSGIDAIAALGASSPIPLAVDESARTVDDVARALGTGAIDVVVIKPQAIGGPDLAMRAVRLALEFGATPVVTTMIDSGVGVRHALHVAAAAGLPLAHGLATAAMLAEDLAEPLRIIDGVITLGTESGLGVTLP